MEIELKSVDKLDYVLVKNLYLPEELSLIKTEIKQLQQHVNNHDPLSAVHNGESLRKGKGVFIQDVTGGPRGLNSSVIHRLSRKIFSEFFYRDVRNHGYMFGVFEDLDDDYTIVSYYGNEDYYKSHTDTAIFTAITFITLDEFEGGELEFSQFNEVIKPVENTMVIFPSAVRHQVNPVKYDKEGFCRASIANFIDYKIQVKYMKR